MRVTDSYPLLPNVCYYCRCANFPGVDLQRDDEDNPNRIERIYLCHKCLIHTARQIAPRVGLSILADLEVDAMRAEMAALAAERDEAVSTAELAIQAAETTARLFVAGRDVPPDAALGGPDENTPEPDVPPALRTTVGVPATQLPKRGPGRPKKEVPA